MEDRIVRQLVMENDQLHKAEELAGPKENIFGDASGLWGRLSKKVSGDVTGIRGDISGITEGDVSLLRGDVTGIEASVEDIINCLKKHKRVIKQKSPA